MLMIHYLIYFKFKDVRKYGGPLLCLCYDTPCL